MNRILVVTALLVFAAAMGVRAHHAFAAEYDETKLVTVKGTVTRFEWVNPHAWLYVEGTDQSGKPAKWSFEMGSPGGLTRRGWKKSAVQEGDALTIDGYRAKDGRNVANARNVTLANGKKLFGGFQSTPRESAK